jgi:DNA-binding transcriptional regulator YdaS (Cro superfamily)
MKTIIKCESEEQLQAIQAARQIGDVSAMLAAIGLTESEVNQAIASLSPEDLVELKQLGQK